MLNQNRLKAEITKSWFNKLACVVGIAGTATLVSVPVLAKFYPPPALFQPSAHRSYPYRNSEKNVADTLAQNSKFANLYYELKQAGLLQTLKQSGNFTIFAPTNEAFNALPKDVFERYSQPQNRQRVLKYHLVAGEVNAKDAKELNGKSITTVEGEQIKIAVDSEGTVKLNNAIGKHPSTRAKNGVIIEVDKVLLPSGF
ncbi:fasciclin domain-containing protein [Brasilonema sp. UFV-L1]|uniref:fasciclin domain-containing protein n=1 Tax=Brasilonema sp. UFV-L1 TaxID=2234130 RepID=UPI00145D3C28|nr:fasciclin domain-containing protein [Brasilonema sp. UFV-L1]NMG07899.1 fasciclin domain-containing protein [Brasilonema sp. UFV-L1]